MWRKPFSHLVEKLVKARLRGRDVLCEQLKPRGRRKAMCDDERAKVEEFRRYNRGLLCRNNNPGGKMSLLTYDREQRVSKSTGRPRLGVRKILNIRLSAGRAREPDALRAYFVSFIQNWLE